MDRTVRKFAGQSVYGANGEKLGTINDFVIDKQSGEVVYAVVSSGGLLGAGNTLRLVPLHALQPAAGGVAGFTVKLERLSWDNAPGLIEEAFDAGIVTVSEEQRRSLDTLFGKAPDRATVASRPRRDDATDRTVASVPRTRAAERAASPWIRASHLRGKEIHAAGQPIGEIEELVIDLDRKTATALVDLDDRVFSGPTRALVPLTELSVSPAAPDTLTTNFTRDDFARLDPTYGQRADAALVPTGRTHTDATSPANVDATLASAARSARQSLDNHAELARADIRIIPENGMLILRGRVRTEQQKEQATDAVKEAASGIRLQNDLIVDPR